MSLTDYLAIYGAALSTFIMVREILTSRPKVAVDLLPGTGGEKGASEFGLWLIIRNTSSHIVHLANVSLLYRHAKSPLKERVTHFLRYRRIAKSAGWVYYDLRFCNVSDGRPCSLEPRKAHKIFIPETEINAVLNRANGKELMACSTDELWGRTYSRPYEYEFTERDT